jgi:pyruvate/2-oxoglutarate dehydrogenase complex dihydrolipoamide acyltransferase (E2) component
LKTRRSSRRRTWRVQQTDQVQGVLGQVVGRVSPAAEGLSSTTEQEPDATKAARRKAEAMDLDLSQVQGSGVGERIIVKGVLGAADTE